MKRILSIILCLCLLPMPRVAAVQSRYVALTFDDGPSGRFTRRLLEGLEQRNVQATFLLCGYRLATYPELAQQIFEAGHEIGLHGYSHKDMATMNRKQLLREIEETEKLLPKGCKAVFLRPPGGSGTPLLAQVSRELGLSVLMWSVDPRDWATDDAASVEAAVIGKVQDGDIILLHDLSNSSVDAALSIIDRLRKDGFQFVTVSRLAAIRGIRPTPGMTYTAFP